MDLLPPRRNQSFPVGQLGSQIVVPVLRLVVLELGKALTETSASNYSCTNSDHPRCQVQKELGLKCPLLVWTPMRYIIFLCFLSLHLGFLSCTDQTPDPQYTVYEKPPEPEAWTSDIEVDLGTFPGGIHITDVTPNGALVSVESNKPTLELRLMEGQGTEWIEIQRHPNTNLSSGRVAHLELRDLQPDTAYSIVALTPDGTTRSRITRFITALPENAARILRFGATSCLGGSNYPWPNLSQAAKAKLDFMLFAGDTVYADSSDSLDGYRGTWEYAFAATGLADLSSSTSLVSTWDDHEIVNDFSWDYTNDESRFNAARQAYFEAMPWRGENIYRVLRWGRTLDIIILDARGERRDGLYLSQTQLEWVKTTLLESRARFKLILNSVPITDMTGLFGNILEGDRWQGFPQQRTELLAFIEDNQIEGTFFVAGDFHYSHVAKVSMPGDIGDSLWEVMAGPAGSWINPVMSLNPPTDEQFDLFVATHTYTYFELDPDLGTVSIQYIGDSGDVVGEKQLQL